MEEVKRMATETQKKIRRIYDAVQKDPVAEIEKLMESLTEEQHLVLMELHLQGHQDVLTEYLAEI
jgi:hypothetical protein